MLPWRELFSLTMWMMIVSSKYISYKGSPQVKKTVKFFAVVYEAAYSRYWQANVDVHMRGLELIKPGVRCWYVGQQTLNVLIKKIKFPISSSDVECVHLKES